MWPEPSAPSTFTLTRCAPGATPRPLLSSEPAPAMIPARWVPWPHTSAPVPFAVHHVDSRADLSLQLGDNRHAGIEDGDADAFAGDAVAGRAEIACPRLVGANRDVGHRHLPVDDVIAGKLRHIRVGCELVEPPGGHLSTAPLVSRRRTRSP